MRIIYVFIVLIIFFQHKAVAQKQSPEPDITGLWKGTLYNDSSKRLYKYEVGISNEKGKLSGFSHTWFILNDTQYYGVKTVKIWRKDGKILVQDDELISNNYPVKPAKGIRQLNVLTLEIKDSIMYLSGPMETNRSKLWAPITGHVELARKNDFWKSSLIPHLAELQRDEELVFVKEDKIERGIALTNKEAIAQSGKDERQREKDAARFAKEQESLAKLQQQQKEKEEKALAKAAEQKKQEEEKAALAEEKKKAAEASRKQKEADALAKKQAEEKEKQEKALAKLNAEERKKAEAEIAKKEKEEAKKQKEQEAFAKKEQAEKERLEKVAAVEKKKKEEEEARMFTLKRQKEIEEAAERRRLTAAADVMVRKTEVQEVVFFSSDSLQLSLYDNGEVDGDTVTVIMNGKIILSKAGLSTHAVKTTIHIPPGQDSIQLIMYAENLGTIEPNTGLIVLRDGKETNEIRFSGDLGKNAAVILKRKR